MSRGRNAQVGDTRVSANGYHYTRVENGWRLTHHLIAEEKILGRPLREDERVHFRTGNKADLTPNNIKVVKKGKASLRQQKARLEVRIEELQAQLDEVNKELQE